MSPIPSFRELFGQIETYEGTHVYEDVLVPRQAQALDAMSVLKSYGSAEAIYWNKDDPDACSGEDRQSYYTCLEHLYALSRVSDLLLLPFEPVRTPEADYVSRRWSDYGEPLEVWTPPIRLGERNEWLRSLGMQKVDHPTFHPFYHEIVDVEQTSDPDEPISLVETLWPGFLLGHMLFCRAGVRICGGEHFISKDIAENSRLYWTYIRHNRKAIDASHGWGHNSQWVTDFRRDYVTKEAHYYNVDGEDDIHEDDKFTETDPFVLKRGLCNPDLTLPQRIELLTNRCFIITPEREFDEFLDNARYREPR